MVSLITATIFKQTVIPVANYLNCFGYGTTKDHSYEDRRFRTHGNENLEETQGLPSGQEYCKSNNCQRIDHSTSFMNYYIPVRFYAEQSMHCPACPVFTKTRLHSLPITKCLENPVTCESPWSQFLGGCRWYSQQSVKNRFHALPITKVLEDPETCVSPWNLFLGASRWYSEQTGKGSAEDAAVKENTQGGNLDFSMGDTGINRGFA